MKKKQIVAAIAAASLLLSSCGLGMTGQTANSAGVLGGLLGGSTIQQTGTSVLGTVLSSILGSTTNQQSIVGTWTYNGPKVVFESENILSQIGGQVVSNNLEQKLGSQLSKMGFTSGKSTVTFNNDGTCTFTLANKQTTGTWSYDSETNKLTLVGALGIGQMTCTASIQAGSLLMLFDADKLLNVATAISSKSTSSLGSLISNYSGLKLGWSMGK